MSRGLGLARWHRYRRALNPVSISTLPLQLKSPGPAAVQLSHRRRHKFSITVTCRRVITARRAGSGPKLRLEPNQAGPGTALSSESAQSHCGGCPEPFKLARSFPIHGGHPGPGAQATSDYVTRHEASASRSESGPSLKLVTGRRLSLANSLASCWVSTSARRLNTDPDARLGPPGPQPIGSAARRGAEKPSA